MPQANAFWGQWIKYREEGRSAVLGYTSQVYQRLYSSILPSFSWDPASSVKNTHHGAVFNLEFSPDGSLLVAATEKKSILLFDPLNHKLVNHVDRAHNDCVNYARFLDSRMFATCSDDTTIAVWDVRYFKNKICTLKGHSNWVKNIEYAGNSGLLVTSGFDGSIYSWDINRYSEGDIQFQRVFHTNGLMRMRLTPDNTKMVICTTGGYLMIIHNLDLDTLYSDLQGFKPNMYRLMQMGNTAFPNGYSFNHLFRARKNRVELVSDFPTGNDAEVISSLQIHPYGWCALSRNTSSDENTEWTCVHDIQEIDSSLDEQPEDEQDNTEEAKKEDVSPDVEPELLNEVSTSDDNPEADANQETTVQREQPVVHIRFNYSRSQEREAERHRATFESFRFGNIELHISRQRVAQSNVTDSVSSNNVLPLDPTQDDASEITALSSSSVPSVPMHSNGLGSDESSSSSSASEESGNSSSQVTLRERPAFFIRTGSEYGAHTFLLLGPNRVCNQENRATHKIHQNEPRLTHFVKEPNVGRGFIKELCFSPDGRLICSPYGFGVRLLAFNPECQELCDSVPSSATKLHELATTLSHSNYVVSTRFSPTHCLMVSGCLNGKICFYQPVL